MDTIIAKVGYDIIKNSVKEFNDTVKIRWNKLPITVKRHLKLDEAAVFVASVVDACFPNDNTYVPENKDPAVRGAVIVLYTNIEPPEDDFEKYDLLYKFGLLDEVYEIIDKTQFEALLDAIDENIMYRIKTNINGFEKKMEDFERSVSDVTEQLKEAFDGISGEEMANIVKLISENGIDEEKLMNAYLATQKEE